MTWIQTMKYPGGKNGAGTYQRIINQIPPHLVYIEPFAGSASILRRKRPAERSIAVDLDVAAIAALRDEVLPEATELIHSDALKFLAEFPWRGSEFVYCDPPYLMQTRRSGPLYAYEFGRLDHLRLLSILVDLPCQVMLSGYWSRLYERALRGWRTDTFGVMTRGGKMAEEWLWMNYPEPAALHDYRYLGSNFREREKFTRQQKRWVGRLQRMNQLQRWALLAAIAEVD
jgi:site-specific DNA-adenine methylase